MHVGARFRRKEGSILCLSEKKNNPKCTVHDLTSYPATGNEPDPVGKRVLIVSYRTMTSFSWTLNPGVHGLLRSRLASTSPRDNIFLFKACFIGDSRCRTSKRPHLNAGSSLGSCQECNKISFFKSIVVKRNNCTVEQMYLLLIAHKYSSVGAPPLSLTAMYI